MKNDWKAVILGELTQALSRVDEQQLDALVDGLTVPGRRVLCVGVGRVLISMKAWVKRLRHLDIDINFVGAESEEAIRPGDLLLAVSSSGESIYPVAISQKAKSLGAQVFYIGCTPGSSVDACADQRLLLAGRTKFDRPGEFSSIQPMSTLVEQQLYLLCDVVALEIMARKGWDNEMVKDRHANLE